jgi:hypothetical protein
MHRRLASFQRGKRDGVEAASANRAISATRGSTDGAAALIEARGLHRAQSRRRLDGADDDAFPLLYSAMLVASSGNTALQSVMPAIGHEIGIAR